MSPADSGASKDTVELTFELMRMIAAPYLGGVDALNITWVRLQTILRGIPILRMLERGGKMSHSQRIAFQKMRDEG